MATKSKFLFFFFARNGVASKQDLFTKFRDAQESTSWISDQRAAARPTGSAMWTTATFLCCTLHNNLGC